MPADAPTDISKQTSADPGACSEDAILGGKLVLRQPRRGHRFGHDAILLAAAVAARPGEHAVEFGAGVGAAGLALARRVEGLDVTLVELDPALSSLAAENANRNGLSARVRAVCLDVRAPDAAFTASGLVLAAADHVLMNPPFNTAQNPSPDAMRRAAHVGSDRMLGQWLDAAARLLRPGRAVTLIWRADGLTEVLAALAAGFGAITVLPVHGKIGSPAIRVVVRAIKASNAPLALLPGFALADSGGKPTVAAETVMRDGAALPLLRS
ncbi:MAG TPA: methyltransferase [Xanthobacteraceae bacterium]|nr:methyltransferase [Xanthobacteraceae bacterium]